VSLLRFLGLSGLEAGREAEPASLRELIRSLEDVPADQARLVAAFAYLLARVAGADLETVDHERETITRRLSEFAALDRDQADRLAEAAIAMSERHGASDDHLVARAFRDMSDHDERIRLVRCLFAIAAADETITALEDNEIFEVATAIGVARGDVVAVRSEWKAYLGSMRALPRER
jgi:uncharacterized tellurite resistance protein B-like protein